VAVCVCSCSLSGGDAYCPGSRLDFDSDADRRANIDAPAQRNSEPYCLDDPYGHSDTDCVAHAKPDCDSNVDALGHAHTYIHTNLDSKTCASASNRTTAKSNAGPCGPHTDTCPKVNQTEAAR
jgi:hypothetical protein